MRQPTQGIEQHPHPTPRRRNGRYEEYDLATDFAQPTVNHRLLRELFFQKAHTQPQQGPLHGLNLLPEVHSFMVEPRAGVRNVGIRKGALVRCRLS